MKVESSFARRFLGIALAIFRHLCLFERRRRVLRQVGLQELACVRDREVEIVEVVDLHVDDTPLVAST